MLPYQKNKRVRVINFNYYQKKTKLKKREEKRKNKKKTIPFTRQLVCSVLVFDMQGTPVQTPCLPQAGNEATNIALNFSPLMKIENGD